MHFPFFVVLFLVRLLVCLVFFWGGEVFLFVLGGTPSTRL